MSHDLAIIIPAYKPDFLEQTLESVLNQTDLRFSLYIFDDASPANIASVVENLSLPEYTTFHRFENNIGQQSIVKQWERCIDHISDEKWIWLFSDDDRMEPDCVEAFYKAKEEWPETHCFRFQTKKIDENGTVVRENNFPEEISASKFLNLKLRSEQESYVVEYIFSKEVHNRLEGFPDLPLAWAADDLFWAKVANQQPIRTIKGPVVSWRTSSLNISGERNRNSSVKKMDACLEFVTWINNQVDIKRELSPKDLPVRWYAWQMRTLWSGLTFTDRLRAVVKMGLKDVRIFKHYWNVLKEKSRVIGWLKYKTGRS